MLTVPEDELKLLVFTAEPGSPDADKLAAPRRPSLPANSQGFNALLSRRGVIVELGDHETLRRGGGLYQELYELQSRQYR